MTAWGLGTPTGVNVTPRSDGVEPTLSRASAPAAIRRRFVVPLQSGTRTVDPHPLWSWPSQHQLYALTCSTVPATSSVKVGSGEVGSGLGPHPGRRTARSGRSAATTRLQRRISESTLEPSGRERRKQDAATGCRRRVTPVTRSLSWEPHETVVFGEPGSRPNTYGSPRRVALTVPIDLGGTCGCWRRSSPSSSRRPRSCR